MQSLNYKNYRIGLTLTIAIAAITLIISFITGKANFFLLLNTDLGKFGDYFFSAYTNMGDGTLWAGVLIILFLLKRKTLLPLVISAFIFTTLLTQTCKYIIVPNEERPTKAITNGALIHKVQGIKLHSYSSFPSGHTATAFTFYLLFCLVIAERWWIIAGLVYAILVAYSRVYLAQHFPLDTAAGMILATISVSLALIIQRKWKEKSRRF
jgi:membrane-associated phospholipid phosphatase